MNDDCGCCGRERPDCCGHWPSCSCDLANQPGLAALAYHAGAYGATLTRMRARLSSAELPALRTLTARALLDPIDPALALLDGWACLSEVLSFYNERLVNECYLRTCTERRSALELARLIGYTPRPGVAADVYLAFTLDDLNKEALLDVPPGTRAYSQPGPGETMQPFETSEALRGRPRWSAMRPRLTEPQRIARQANQLSFKGITTGLRPGDALLFEFKDGDPALYKVAKVEPLPQENRTRVELQASAGDQTPAPAQAEVDAEVLRKLIQAPALHTANQARLKLKPADIFQPGSYAPLALLGAAYPALRESLGAALGGTATAEPTGAVTIYAMRVKAAPHGHNAPLEPIIDDGIITGYEEWDINEKIPARRPQPDGGSISEGGSVPIEPPGGGLAHVERALSDEEQSQLPLDAVYDQIALGSRVVIERPDREKPPQDASIQRWTFARVSDIATVSRVEYQLPARVTQLKLDKPWLDKLDRDLESLRKTTVYAQSEPLELAEAPITDEVKATEIVLDGYYDGLQPGRRMILAGERADLNGVQGVRAAELVMIAAVAHQAATEPPPPDTVAGRAAVDQPAQATGETIHTRLKLAQPGLSYRYKRDTVTIYGNVAHATHGESRAETLGGGDAARALQVFALRQTPLTYVSAPTPSGVASTLDVRVNDLRWHAAPNVAAIEPGERRYVVQTDDEGATRLVFGLGARLPTGRDNVRAVYRSGIGSAGNVKAGQISVLAARPNGVMGVTNPRISSGGADRDGLDQIKRRAPIGLAALDRLVSAEDFADFARAFAGIGKADVTYADSNLILTIAGESDAPIAQESALFGNLKLALMRYGDLAPHPDDKDKPNPRLRSQGNPPVTVSVVLRNALLLAIRARVRLLPDYLWEAVRPQIEATLYTVFGFDARELGQPAYAAEAIAAIQAVRGVAFVDLDVFGMIDTGTPDQPKTPEEIAAAALELLKKARPDSQGGVALVAPPPAAVGADGSVQPAGIVYLSPTAPGTLLLALFEEETQP
jgi:predicted phage baseplate assembly protein